MNLYNSVNNSNMQATLQRLIISLILHAIFIIQAEGFVQSQPTEPLLKQETWIIVFVHGIISIKPYLNFPNVVKFLRDRIAETSYERTIELTRQDEFFFQHHPMQKPGLHKIELNNENCKPGAAACAYAQLFEKMFALSGNTPQNYYYTFGWSGLLSPRIRHLESKILYDQLLKVVLDFKRKGINPKIALICYSHGGNIALKLPHVYINELYSSSHKLTIDQLILFGLPVLPETDYLINSSMFKRIYHFFSYGDRVQRLDIFSLSRISSNRMFHERSDFKIPKKLVQVELRIRRPIKGKEKQYSSPAELEHILFNKRSCMRNADPGHSELWSFGWAPTSYRSSFPFNPLPVAALTPYLIKEIEKLYPNAAKITIEMHPYYEHSVWYNPFKKTKHIEPFLSKEQMNTLKEIAYQYQPHEYSQHTYNSKIKFAKVKARKEWLANRKIRRFGNFKRYTITEECLDEPKPLYSTTELCPSIEEIQKLSLTQ